MDKKLRFMIFLVLAAAIVYLTRFTEARDFFTRENIESLVPGTSSFSIIIFSLIYILATILFLPGTPFTLAGGFVFGPLRGTIVVILSATLGAFLAFLIGRFFTRDFVSGLIKKRFKKLREYDTKLEEHGFLTIIFLRLVPLFPFNGLNYALALTKIKKKDYFLGTLIGIIPGTFSYVYIGSIVRRLGSDNIMRILLTDPVFYVFLAVFIFLLFVPNLYKRYERAIKDAL